MGTFASLQKLYDNIEKTNAALAPAEACAETERYVSNVTTGISTIDVFYDLFDNAFAGSPNVHRFSRSERARRKAVSASVRRAMTSYTPPMPTRSAHCRRRSRGSGSLCKPIFWTDWMSGFRADSWSRRLRVEIWIIWRAVWYAILFCWSTAIPPAEQPGALEEMMINSPAKLIADIKESPSFQFNKSCQEFSHLYRW